MLYNIKHVLISNMCHVMLYISHVVLYNMCHVMLYKIGHVYNIRYVILYNILCYVI